MHLCSHKTHRFLKESSPTDVCAGGPNALHFTGHFKSCFFIFPSCLKSLYFFFFFKSRLLSHQAPLQLNFNIPPGSSMGAQQRRLGFYFSKSKEGTCHVERSPTGSGGGGSKNKDPGMYGWTDRQTFPSCQLSKLKTPQRESESESRSVGSDSLQPYGLYSPWNSPGQNTGVGNLSLLQ